MKILVTGDWQCSISNLDRCLILKDQIIRLLKSYPKNDNVFFLHLGDIKEAHNPVDVRVTNFIVETFQEIRSLCTGILFVKGNHDMLSSYHSETSCSPLISALKVTVAENTWIKVPIRLLTWKSTVVRYLLLYMVPYIRDLGHQKRLFAEASTDASLLKYHDSMSTAVGTNNVKILAFHNTITGCKQNLYSKGSELNINDIGAKNYDLCLGGHIHVPQKLDPNVVYVGSPFAMTWNECNTEHRILQITIDEGKS